MIAGACVEIQCIRVRVVVRRDLHTLTRKLPEPVDERWRAVQLSDERRELIDRMAADASTLLVSRQVVAVDGGLDGRNGRYELCGDLGCEEL